MGKCAYFQKINNKYTLKLSLNMKQREWVVLVSGTNRIKSTCLFDFLMHNLR
jgi:hypothetical protein